MLGFKPLVQGGNEVNLPGPELWFIEPTTGAEATFTASSRNVPIKLPFVIGIDVSTLFPVGAANSLDVEVSNLSSEAQQATIEFTILDEEDVEVHSTSHDIDIEGEASETSPLNFTLDYSGIYTWDLRMTYEGDTYVVDSGAMLALTAEQMDDDGDGYTEEDGDCDDTDPGVNPEIIESKDAGNCSGGKDNDCDGLTDADPECEGCFIGALL